MLDSKSNDPRSFCPQCGKSVEPLSNFCQNCGQKNDSSLAHQPEPKAPKADSYGGRGIFLAILGAVVLAIVAAAFSPANVLESWSPLFQEPF